MNPVERRDCERKCEGLLQEAIERAELQRTPSIISVPAGTEALVPVGTKLARVMLTGQPPVTVGPQLTLKTIASVWTGKTWSTFLTADCQSKKMAAVLDHIMAALKYWAEIK